MTAISFSVFKDKILGGEKTRTIRKVRKNPIKVGDRLQLYWHQQSPNNELLFDTVCTEINKIKITHNSIYLYTQDGVLHDRMESNLDDFAIADGFNDWNHMREWFQQQHGLPFEGVLIKWEPKYMQGAIATLKAKLEAAECIRPEST